MAVDSRRAALKTLLLAPVAPIQVWAIRQLVTGEVVAGAVALVIGMAMVGVYVVIQEYDLPYEEEVTTIAQQLVTDSTQQTVEEAVKDVARESDVFVTGQSGGGDGNIDK